MPTTKQVKKLARTVKRAAKKLDRKPRRRQTMRRPTISGFDYANRFNLTSKMVETRSRDGKVLTVSGRDLVANTAILKAGQAVKPGVFMIVPANPSLWLGTRIGRVSANYQYYSPVRFKVYYIPQVAVTQPGNVTLGTLWQSQQDEENLQQTLVTSNGGILTQVYSAATSNVRITSDLPQRNYAINANPAEQQCVPFYWMAYVSGVPEEGISPPGFVVVEYTFRLCNPQGKNNALSDIIGAIQAEKSIASYMLRHPSNRLNLAPAWGIAVGLLKTLSAPLLDKVACFLLDKTNTLVNKVHYGIGKLLNWSHSNVKDALRANDDTTVVIDPISGEEDLISDDTPVLVFEQGNTVGEGEPSPSGSAVYDYFAVKSVTVVWTGKLASGDAYHQENQVNPKLEVDAAAGTLKIAVGASGVASMASHVKLHLSPGSKTYCNTRNLNGDGVLSIALIITGETPVGPVTVVGGAFFAYGVQDATTLGSPLVQVKPEGGGR